MITTECLNKTIWSCPCRAAALSRAEKDEEEEEKTLQRKLKNVYVGERVAATEIIALLGAFSFPSTYLLRL